MSHFVVTSWFAYETSIVGVFATREEALAFIGKFTKCPEYGWHEFGEWPDRISANRVRLEVWQGNNMLSFETILDD